MKVVGNLMKCLNPLNNFFHCLANGQGGWVVEECQNVHLKKCCRKFDEMLKSTSNFFHCLANQRGVVGWLRMSKCAPEPKLQEI